MTGAEIEATIRQQDAQIVRVLDALARVEKLIDDARMLRLSIMAVTPGTW